jgi:uncharacterized protein YdiU (UPF0061 family)
MRLGLEHTYAALPERFYARVAPTRVANPQLAMFNPELAAQLGLDAPALEPQAAALFSGNELPEDALPIAMAYAGHQFGGFVPRLGDGRAILLGELRDRCGVLRDVQLKGAGRTPYSRGGDGRAALGPMLREYLISEAMHALGIATTRSLAVITTGEPVYREAGALPGAILTRIAAGHVRVGTFQYFAAREDQDALRTLLDYVIARHYPAARSEPLPALSVLREISRRQAELVARWMLVGFIHGVMNTDNMSLAGETIDYGPCAFMDEYDPGTVFSSIDRGGRYAYANQAAISQWNLARFAETMLPLIDPDTDKAVQVASAVIEEFMEQADAQLLSGMRRKLGLFSSQDADKELIRGLLLLMREARADFTLTFRALSEAAAAADALAKPRTLLGAGPDADTWLAQWQQRVASEAQPAVERARAMRLENPAVIARNHRVEAVLRAAEQGDYAPFRTLLAVLQRPYEDPQSSDFTQPPAESERVLQTFCGT